METQSMNNTNGKHHNKSQVPEHSPCKLLKEKYATEYYANGKTIGSLLKAKYGGGVPLGYFESEFSLDFYEKKSECEKYFKGKNLSSQYKRNYLLKALKRHIKKFVVKNNIKEKLFTPVEIEDMCGGEVDNRYKNYLFFESIRTEISENAALVAKLLSDDYTLEETAGISGLSVKQVRTLKDKIGRFIDRRTGGK